MIRSSLRQLSSCEWEIPASARDDMRTSVRIYATPELLSSMDENVFHQAMNVAGLPGIVGNSFCMPDGHSGYGFPIGGVAAFDTSSGVISPGGIGFDINCGMRLITTDLTLAEVKPKLKTLVDRLFTRVPAGVGSKGTVHVSPDEFRQMLEMGGLWALRRGYATEEDLRRTEENGSMKGADAGKVSQRAVDRGIAQIGTLGSGNHYLEIQVVREQNIFDREVAQVFGISRPEQVVVMLHCGSRGFGHQVASDYLKSFLQLMGSKFRLSVPDRELACVPFASEEGQAYFAAMQCAVNMAFVNRQLILHRIREVFGEVFGRDPSDLGIRQVYDVTHNTAKVESHVVEGNQMALLVHRKGATRAFAPGMEDIPPEYAATGQPVIIGGSMETGSYLLSGVPTGVASFYSTAHGSGRAMGRGEAKRRFRGSELRKQMMQRGIYVRSVSDSGLAEEAGGAYKNIDQVVQAAETAGLSRRVAKFEPLGCIKG